MYGLAVKPAKDADAQRTGDALHAVVAEDPSLNLDHNATLNEVVLRGHGELHLRTVLEQIKDRYGLEVKTALPSIAYRETITASAEGHHRHKKQTGGAGQFGEVYLRIEPCHREAVSNSPARSWVARFRRSTFRRSKPGVRQAMDTGALYGYPMQDIKVTVYDGKHHSVDSKGDRVRTGRQKGLSGCRIERAADRYGADRGCERSRFRRTARAA